MSKTIAGGLTQEQIDQLKKKHGPLMLVTIKPNGKEEHFWFKKPEMVTMKASAAVSQRDPLESTSILFKNCLVEGDMDAVKNVDKFMSIAPKLESLIEGS